MNFRQGFFTRRELLQRTGMGMGAVALTALLGESGSLNAATLGTTTMNPIDPRHDPPLSETDIQAYADGFLTPERAAHLRLYLGKRPGEARRARHAAPRPGEHEQGERGGPG